ncbi:hypothetical protein IFM89_009814 [Coptis chinensis]|uniref:AP2/ERF domain-containing protein n=1 Tax=Coptis chinensis TaxID=261450 RepID=A0A835I1T4_9MAGN|nr:hypothetical protein IFM89_009814 [Coptis chinensis]
MVKTEDNIQDPSKSMPTSSCRKRKYKGVRMRSWGSWVSEIRAPNQKTRIWLGSYSTAEAAARAYDAALLCLKGSSANLNFPITSSIHIPDTIMSPKSIQRVAAAAAAAYNNEDIATGTPTTTPSISTLPPNLSSTYSSPSSSPSNHNDDHDTSSLIPSWPSSYTTCGNEDQWMHASPVDPWIDFDCLQSPKYNSPDQMLNACGMFAPPTIEDFYEEGDIHLWNFC